MNNGLLIILICIGVCGLVIGVSYFLKKYKIDTKQYNQSIDLTKTVVVFTKITLQDMDKFNDTEIDNITNIVIRVLDYLKENNNMPKETAIENSVSLAVMLCKECNVTLNEDKMYVMTNLITLIYNIYESFEAQNEK